MIIEMAIRERTSPAERAATVADVILSLAEPWRTRFVTLVARYAGVEGSAEPPSREDMVVWLQDEDLYDKIRLMLRTWTHSG